MQVTDVFIQRTESESQQNKRFNAYIYAYFLHYKLFYIKSPISLQH